MVRLAVVLLFLMAVPGAGLLRGNHEPVPTGQDGRWFLLFSDEFEGETINAGKWVPCYWWDYEGCTNAGNEELEWYLPDNIRIEDGILRLEAREGGHEATDGNTYPYTSGMVTTGRSTSDLTAPPKFTFQNGFAEIRARIPAGAGLWPAFWMLPASQNSRPEIDIVEFLGHETDEVKMRFNFTGEDGRRTSRGCDWLTTDMAGDWHTYGVNWQPEHIIWYIDGVERCRYSTAENIPQEPMYLLLNLAVGGVWPGPPDEDTEFPASFEIDYVRVWNN